MTEFYLSDSDGRRFQGTSSDPIGNFSAITHDCPMCGQKASRGRSLIWIAHECTLKGKAIFPCESCGKVLFAPSDIFVKETLESLKSPDMMRPNMMGYAIREMSQRELLVQDWGQVLFAANKGGPVDLESLEWDGIGTCPGCGKEFAEKLSQQLVCIWCQADFWVNQEDISHTGNTNVLCPSCKRGMVIPPTVWCPTCGRNIRPSNVFVRLFKEANQARRQSQVEIPSMRDLGGVSETRNDTISRAHKKWWQFWKK